MDSEGNTALHDAAWHGDREVAEALLKAKCNPDIQNKKGDTALHLAAYTGHEGVAEALLKAGCNADLQNTNHGNTVFHVTV